jgi:hypothetical protein
MVEEGRHKGDRAHPVRLVWNHGGREVRTGILACFPLSLFILYHRFSLAEAVKKMAPLLMETASEWEVNYLWAVCCLVRFLWHYIYYNRREQRSKPSNSYW